MSVFSLDSQVELKSKIPARAEELPEGSYAGTVTKAGLKNLETKNGPATLFEINLLVDGSLCGITYWLTSESNLRRCLTGLKRIGFECDQWGPAFDRPYTQELQAAAEKLTGQVLSFRRGTSATGFATIGLDSLDEAGAEAAPASSAANTDDLPF